MRDAFFDAYVECALWSSLDENGHNLDDNYTSRDIDVYSLAVMRLQCDRFQKNNQGLLDKSGLAIDRLGHNFWLSRNGHGSGFFDEGTPVDEELQHVAKECGECNLYIGDDGKLCIS